MIKKAFVSQGASWRDAQKFQLDLADVFVSTPNMLFRNDTGLREKSVVSEVSPILSYMLTDHKGPKSPVKGTRSHGSQGRSSH